MQLLRKRETELNCHNIRVLGSFYESVMKRKATGYGLNTLNLSLLTYL